MTGHQAFKYHTALRLHFLKDDFDVFENRGRIRGSFAAFQKRPDRMLFEKAARKYTDREFILLVAANIMYGNDQPIYNLTEAEKLYHQYQKRRQSITYIFEQDLARLPDLQSSTLLSKWMAEDITMETVCILSELLPQLWENSQDAIGQLFENEIRRVQKAKRFVKYNKTKVENVLHEHRERNNGQDVSTQSV